MSIYPLPISELEKTIGYNFKDNSIIKTALTHSSFANEYKSHNRNKKFECNERLEFLGDSVLSLITSEYIFEKYKDSPEGVLTKVRASVVCSQSLSYLASSINLGDYLFLGKGEEDTGRASQKILENTFEALLAAIYLDSGNSKETVAKFLLPLIIPEIEKSFGDGISRDYKTALQQFVQASGHDRIQYMEVGEYGPDHNKKFVMEVKLNSNVVGRGEGRTKKEAEQFAAKEALALFDVK